MKPAPFALAALLLLPAAGIPAPARATEADGFQISCDPPVRWSSRHDTREARMAITSREGEVDLILTDRVVAVQLSDRVMRKIRRETRQELNDEEDNPVAQAIKTVVLSGVRVLLNHSAECPVRDLDDVEYRNGRLVLTSEDGKRLFDNMEVNDDDLLASFSERDARAFALEFQRVKARIRGKSI